MPPQGPAIGSTAPKAPPRWRHGFTPAIALLGVLFAWVPGLGLLLSLAGLVMGVWGRRHGVRVRSSTWAIGLAALGLVLGAICTAAYVFLLPPPPDPADEARWEQFERLFEPP